MKKSLLDSSDVFILDLGLIYITALRSSIYFGVEVQSERTL